MELLDVVGYVKDKEADWDGFSLGPLPKDGVEVNVAPGGYLFTRKAIYWLVVWNHGGVRKLKFLVDSPVEDINGAALINEDFLNSVIFDFNRDNHGVILLMVEAVKVIIYEDDGTHTASVVGMGDVVNRLDMEEVSFSGRRNGSSASKATRDGVNGAKQGRVGRGDVGVGRLRFLSGGLGELSIVTGVMWRTSVIGSRGWWDREEEECSSLRMKRRKWPTRTSFSILSWSALHYSVV